MGVLTIRVEEGFKKRIRVASAMENMSMNKFIVEVLEGYLEDVEESTEKREEAREKYGIKKKEEE